LEAQGVKAILFDAAGTLFRVRGSVGQAYATVAARHGVEVDPHDIEERFRRAFVVMPPLAFPGTPVGELLQRELGWWQQVATAAFAGIRFANFDAFFRDLFDYFAHADAWELFADVRPALQALQARGLRLGIVSNFDGRLVGICEGLGIADTFETIVMSGRTGCAKPDPRIFGVALDRLRVAAAEAMHVGDSDNEDVKGAQAAGVRPVLIQREGAVAHSSECLNDLRELLSLV
jgi:putative hydrolase of the HAD superfamily